MLSRHAVRSADPLPHVTRVLVGGSTPCNGLVSEPEVTTSVFRGIVRVGEASTSRRLVLDSAKPPGRSGRDATPGVNGAPL